MRNDRCLSSTLQYVFEIPYYLHPPGCANKFQASLGAGTYTVSKVNLSVHSSKRKCKGIFKNCPKHIIGHDYFFVQLEIIEY